MSGTPTHRRSTVGVALVLAACLAGGLLGPGAALADPPIDPSQAQAQADALRAQVQQLETAVEVAGQQYAAATDALGTVVTQEISAQQSLDSARTASWRAKASLARRVSALYMSGGQLALTATVMTGGDVSNISDLFDRMQAVQRIVAVGRDDSTQAAANTDAAVVHAQQVTALRARQSALEAAAAQAQKQAQAALDARSALLAQADARVVALVEQQREQAQQAALASAARDAASLGVLPDAPAPNSLAAAAIAAARSVMGTPYQWGAVGPSTFDCSGLTSWAYRQAGVSLARTAEAQYATLPPVPLSQLAPGDLVFFSSDGTASGIHHVGLYVGGGLMLNAPHTGDVVRLASIANRELLAAARPTA